MSLIRWKPADEFWGTNILDRIFAPEISGTPIYRENSHWLPETDVTEDGDKYTMRIELPGLDKENVQVTVENGILTVKGEKKEKAELEKARYHRLERRYGAFTRSFKLPGSIQKEQIEAAFKDGILSIELPKKEDVKPKAIDVKIS